MRSRISRGGRADQCAGLENYWEACGPFWAARVRIPPPADLVIIGDLKRLSQVYSW
jgi:hypothetical protein